MAVKLIGLTGAIGAGKSTALAGFAELGADTLSADAVVHELYGSEQLRDAVVGLLRGSLRGVVGREPVGEGVR